MRKIQLLASTILLSGVIVAHAAIPVSTSSKNIVKEQATQIKTDHQTNAKQVININQADVSTLMQLKGIGEKRAEAIIAYRKQHGAFKQVEDLTKIRGIGQGFIDKNKKQLIA